MSLESLIEQAKNIKESIRQKINDKGVPIAATVPFAQYPDYIQQIEKREVVEEPEWTPDPLWWDIENILKNDTNTDEDAELDNYNKYIVLLDDGSDDFTCYLTTNNAYYIEPYAIKTSDNKIYKATGSNVSITHTWNKSLDKQSSIPNIKTRYVIFYIQNFSTGSQYRMLENIPDALYMIIDTPFVIARNTSWKKLEAIKFLEKAKCTSVGAIYSTVNLKFIETNNPLNMIQLFNQADANTKQMPGNKLVLKLTPKAYIKQDETTLLKTWDLTDVSSAETATFTLDVSNIDFTDSASNIFIKSNIYKIKGVINLENNTSNSKYTLFNSYSNSMGVLREFSLNLPKNADIEIQVPCMTDKSLKYLIENAPEITESHTLTVSPNVYAAMQYLPREMPITYKENQYFSGIQVLNLKGWTVAQA